jgi:phage terminase small subunit
MKKYKLNIRQQRFIDNLFEGKSQKDAYIAAGYKGKGKSAEASSSEILRNLKVVAEIGRRLNDINTKNKVRLGRISEVALSEALKIIKDPLVDPKIKVDAIKDILDRVGLKTTENINLKLSGELKVTDAREKILSRLNGLTSRKGKKRDNKQPK